MVGLSCAGLALRFKVWGYCVKGYGLGFWLGSSLFRSRVWAWWRLRLGVGYGLVLGLDRAWVWWQFRVGVCKGLGFGVGGGSGWGVG